MNSVIPPNVLEIQTVVAERAPVDIPELASELRARRIPIQEERLRTIIDRYPDLFTTDHLGRVVIAVVVDGVPPPAEGSHAGRPAGWWQELPEPEPLALSQVAALDIETTGLDRHAHEITELALVDLDGRTVWSSTMDPGDAKTVDALTELSKAMAKFDAVLGHSLQRFDLPFLEAAAIRLGVPWTTPDCVLDVHELSVLVDPTLDGRSLTALCDHLGVVHEAAHTAVGDAVATAAVAQRLIERIDPADPSWALALRVLAAGGHGWDRLVAPPSLPSALADGLASVPDPLAIPLDPSGPQEPVRHAVRAGFAAHAAEIEGYRTRPAQLEMAEAVGDVLAGTGHLLVEAPTGTGKSLAYLIPAAWRAEVKGSPVVIATHTRVLQRQLRDDAEALRRSGVLRAPFRQIQGVGNYLCPRNVAETIEAGEETTTWMAVAVAIRALAVAPNGLWDDVTDALLTRSDLNFRRQRAVLRPTPATCERWACDYVKQCPLYQRLEGINQHPGVVATNHALVALWTKQAAEGELPGGLFGDRPTALVIDEAHNLEDSLTSAWADRVSAVSLAVLRAGVYGRNGVLRQIRTAGGDPDAVADLAHLERDFGGTLASLGDAVATYLHDFGGAGQSTELRPAVVRGRPLYRDVIQAATRTAALLRVLQARLIAAKPEVDQAKLVSARRRIDGLIDDAGEASEALALLKDLPEAHAYLHRLSVPAAMDSSNPAEEWEFERLPIEISPLYQRYLAAASDSVVLTSATLRVADSFAFLGSRLGVSVEEEGDLVGSTGPTAVASTGLAVESPFNHTEQSAVVLTSHLPLPVLVSQDEFCEELGADQVGLLSLTGGRTLGLFAARSRMNAVASVVRSHSEALAERGVDLLVQGDDSPARIQQRFKTKPGTVVYGVRSYWEGFDAPGETLSYLLIEKPPYPHPDDELARARQRAIQDRGGDSFMEYVVPLTAIAMTQGFGRLIRRETDRGVALIADRRMQQPSAANGVLLGSLPTETLHYASDREDAWRYAISFVTGEEPDLTQALLVSADRIGDLLAELRLEPGEDPDEKLRRAALELFGISALRPEQMEIMRALLAGQDVMGFLPTGSGKSLTFQLPALLHPDGLPTVVVSPLVALIKDQVDELRGQRGIRVVAGITGRTSGAERTETMRDLADGKIRLLYVSPERLVRDPTLRQSIAHQRLGAIVVDEAHCVSSWGHDFRPEFRQIASAVKAFQRSPRLALTATATREVEADIAETLELHDPVSVRRPMDRPDLAYWVRKVTKDADRTRELLRIVSHMSTQPGIVYATRRALTEELAWILREAGIAARAYHAGLVPEQREAVQDDFLAGSTQVIVATKAFGMGVNKPDIGWVVHYDLPESLEAYAQEAGRAARSPDLHGLCVLFFTGQDIKRRQGHLAKSGAAEDVRKAEMLLARLADYPVRGEDHLVDPDELAAALAMETDELNVLVAWLERAGALERRHDCSWRARVSAGVREPEERAERGQFVRLVKQQMRCRVGTSRLIQVDEMAAQCALDPDALEELLIDWSLRRLVTFHATQRRWRLRRRERLDRVRLESVIKAWHDTERARLREMIRYAEGTECRRLSILRAFGDDAGSCGPAVDPCDVHTSGAPPWHEVPITDVVDPEQLVDAELVLLQAVRWSTFKDGSYGEVSLKAAVCGKESLGEGRPIGAGLLSCPQFGALRYLRSPDKRLDKATTSLLDGGFLERAQVSRGDRTYASLRLTEAGRARLEARS